MWGNPFKIPAYTREQAILNFITAHCTDTDYLLAIRERLQGKNLGCFCAPKKCHGDWLLHVANCDEEEFDLIMTGSLTAQEYWDRIYPNG